MKAVITTVQRMSIHDGPGIRSTVFFKGCNLRCKWCHNPETWSPHPQLQHTAGKCIRCGGCLSACPQGALSLPATGSPEGAPSQNPTGAFSPNPARDLFSNPTEAHSPNPTTAGIAVDRDRCIVCGTCTRSCPSGAMTTVGREVGVWELMCEIMRDKPFFERSGGGVTLSGGEPLLQPQFAAALLQTCRREGIHTAIETNLHTDPQTIRTLLPLPDLWMCDLKLAESAAHRKWTGSGNEKIIANLRLLDAGQAPVIVRTPVIPGVNDTPEAIGEICRLLAPMHNILRYELLGFHVLGFDKFAPLGIENPLAQTPPLDKRRLEELRRVAAGFGWEQP